MHFIRGLCGALGIQMKGGRRHRTSWLGAIGMILLCAVLFVVALLFNSIGSVSWGNWQSILNGCLLFAIVGAYYGTILVFDGEADKSNVDRPLLRFCLCAAFGALTVLLIRAWSPQSFGAEWALVGAIVGGALGGFGWSWAKYVDF
jgi:hypothetical protein